MAFTLIQKSHKRPAGVFILWMNHLRDNYLLEIFKGSDFKMGTEELGKGLSGLDKSESPIEGEKVITNLKTKYEYKDTLKDTIVNLQNKVVSAFDREFAKFCGKIWKGYYFSFKNKEGIEIVIHIEDVHRNYWKWFHAREMKYYNKHIGKYKQWFNPNVSKAYLVV